MKGYVVKLVRDRIGERVGPERSFHYQRVRSSDEHARLLREKLLEEAGEYLMAPHREARRAELADLLEVIDALARVDCDCSITDIWNLQREKRDQRGGFEDGTIMVATDDGWSGDPRPGWGEG